MERIRKPFQGVSNIVRFNWHFYVLGSILIIVLLIINILYQSQVIHFLNIFSLLVFAGIIISLGVSFFVYDLSGLYLFTWLDKDKINIGNRIVNINAGFDETSLLLKNKFPGSDLTVFDFYDPGKHTEISIKRARKAYPAYPDTTMISTTNIPLSNNMADDIFLILAAHEIRNIGERIIFLKELKRILKPDGKIFIMEHLRDLPNFLAYNIGFFHFFSKSSWLNSFNKAGLIVNAQMKMTPFITIFILEKNGITA